MGKERPNLGPEADALKALIREAHQAAANARAAKKELEATEHRVRLLVINLIEAEIRPFVLSEATAYLNSFSEGVNAAITEMRDALRKRMNRIEDAIFGGKEDDDKKVTVE